MTQKQIQWAKSHDWFLLDLGNGRIIVKDDHTIRTEQGAVVLVTAKAMFEDFKTLKEWAGY